MSRGKYVTVGVAVGVAHDENSMESLLHHLWQLLSRSMQVHTENLPSERRIVLQGAS